MPTPPSAADARRVAPDRLRWRIEVDTTERVDRLLDPEPLPGQGEVLADLAATLRRPARHHLLVTGLTGPSRCPLLAEQIRRLLRGPPRRRDLVYVARPRDPTRPRLIELPAGRADPFRRDLLTLRDELRLAWPDDLSAGPSAWRAALAAAFQPLRSRWTEAAAFFDELFDAVVDRADLFRPGVDPSRRGREGDTGARDLLSAFQAHVFHRAAADRPPVVIAGSRPGVIFGGQIRSASKADAGIELLRSGQIHDAHGGVLVVDARDFFGRTLNLRHFRTLLRTGRLAPDSLRFSGMAPLRPDPIPLDVQIVVVAWAGNHLARWMADPDLQGTIRTPVQFRPDAPLTPALIRELHAWLEHRLADRFRVEGWSPRLSTGATAAIVAHLQREGGRGGRVPMDLDAAKELAVEATVLARARPPEDTAAGAAEGPADGGAEGGADDTAHAPTLHVTRAHVEQVRADHLRRRSLSWQRSLDRIERGVLHIQTEGRAIGQVNGLAVYRGSGFAFARPIRITAVAGAGRGGLIDIERDSGLSGKLHNKGVRVFAGFLRGRFGRRQTLAIQASIGIEQHYGNIDGDSASLAEACALLSAIAMIPLRQDRAVTGSVDQLGRVQSVGSVTAKVEGYYAVCSRRGLTGTQGVVVPAPNIDDLMLTDELLDSVAAGRFHVWSAARIEDALAVLLEGQPAGEGEGQLQVGEPMAEQWPEDSFYGRVVAELRTLEQVMRRSTKGPGAT